MIFFQGKDSKCLHVNTYFICIIFNDTEAKWTIEGTDQQPPTAWQPQVNMDVLWVFKGHLK